MTSNPLKRHEVFNDVHLATFLVFWVYIIPILLFYCFSFCPSLAHLGFFVNLCHVSGEEVRDVRSQRRREIKGDYRFSTEGEEEEKKKNRRSARHLHVRHSLFLS